MRNETRQVSQEKARMRQKLSKDISIEPPIGGWNTRDALDNVPPEDALLLENWTCGLGNVAVRYGAVPHSYSTYATDHTATAVQTLAKYDGGGNPQLIAADGGQLWVATSPGSKTTIEGAGPYSSDVWSWTNFRGQTDQALLILVNGSEAVQYSPGQVGGDFLPLNPALDPAINPIGCMTFKNRVYYWEAGSQSVWYTGLYAYGGPVTEFNLGDVGAFGGGLIAVVSWTHDGGHGTDDYILFVMDSGEVLAYQGSFPESEADWALVGIYNPGRAMGPRSFAKFGGDLYMMTDLDIVPMSQVIAGVEQNRQLTKISGAMQAVAGFRGSFGFQAELFPPSKLMVFNVPGEEVDTFDQFVMNTVTGAWSRWKGRGSYCWLEFEGKLYYGTEEGQVYEAENGFVDYRLGTIPPKNPGIPGPGPTFPTPTLLAPLEIPYLYGGPVYPGQARTFDDTPPGGATKVGMEFSQIGADNTNYSTVLLGLTVGTQFTFNADGGSGAARTLTITEEPALVPINNGEVYFVYIVGDFDVETGFFDNGEPCILTLGDVEPPPPGQEGIFVKEAIKSDVQGAWLRFGVEENKQFDAVKLFFKGGTIIPHNMAFATDYKEIKAIEYPDPFAAIGVPWSGEWDPDLAIPPTIPAPTTWWTDEGTNPTSPVNEDTNESGAGAVTKWAAESVTTEKWEIINGYGRAISMYMKAQTEERAEWNLTFWHLKLGSRM